LRRHQAADTGLNFATNPGGIKLDESPITVIYGPIYYASRTMQAKANNIIQFPAHRRREVHGCPHCGTRNDVWQIGRLLWGYCERHEVRWVVANYESITRATINRRELRKGLEFLSTFAEVSH
jgi:hypothetical protein